MKTYNLNHTISVELFPKGELVYLDHLRKYMPKDKHLSDLLISNEYDTNTHIWTGQLHSFMGIFGAAMLGGGVAFCSTEIELLDEVKDK